MTVRPRVIEGVERWPGGQSPQREGKRVRARLPHFHCPQEHEAQINRDYSCSQAPPGLPQRKPQKWMSAHIEEEAAR